MDDISLHVMSKLSKKGRHHNSINLEERFILVDLKHLDWEKHIYKHFCNFMQPKRDLEITPLNILKMD